MGYARTPFGAMCNTRAEEEDEDDDTDAAALPTACGVASPSNPPLFVFMSAGFEGPLCCLKMPGIEVEPKQTVMLKHKSNTRKQLHD